MAVSLSDAWNDILLSEPATPKEPSPKAIEQPIVSAKVAEVLDVGGNADAPPPPRAEVSPSPPNAPSYDELIFQLDSLRREESRRCTIYLAIGGILFAILFVYIDRLNQQVRMLNTFLLHRHMPTLAALSAPMPYHT